MSPGIDMTPLGAAIVRLQSIKSARLITNRENKGGRTKDANKEQEVEKCGKTKMGKGNQNTSVVACAPLSAGQVAGNMDATSVLS